MDEQVDILQPPLFEPTGEVKSREQAYRDGDWIGTFNLWIVSKDPEPAIIYQQRSPKAKWAPNLLDVTAGGHLQAGEKLTDGLREVDEELGKHYSPDEVVYLGRKLYVGFNANGTSHNNIIDLYMIEDNAPLQTYTLEEAEVYALCACPVSELLKAHHDPEYSFEVQALTASRDEITINVNKASFPVNWDNYHYKIAVLVDRYFKGEKGLLY
jgi:isopentenyldiphosphate isomerase